MALIGAAGLLLATAATVWACSPNALIRLPLSNGAAGTTVSVHGEAFDRGAVRVQWVPTGQVLVQTTGPSFAVPVTIPEGAPAGVHYIEALGFNEAGEQVGHTSVAFTVETVEAAPGTGGGDAPGQPGEGAPETGPVGSQPAPVGSQPATVGSAPAPAPAASTPAPAPAAPSPEPAAGAPAPEPAGSAPAPHPAAGADPALVPAPASAPVAAPAPPGPAAAGVAPVASTQPGTASLDPTQPVGTTELAGVTHPLAGDPVPREHLVPRGVEPLGHDSAAALAATPSQRSAGGDLWGSFATSDAAPLLNGSGVVGASSDQALHAVGPAALGIGMVLLFGVTFTLVARRRGILVGARTHSGDVADR